MAETSNRLKTVLERIRDNASEALSPRKSARTQQSDNFAKTAHFGATLRTYDTLYLVAYESCRADK
jgi:hypothetical protein